MKIFVFLNEITLLRVLFLVVQKRPFYLLGCNPVFPAFKGQLERIARWLYRSGRAGDAIEEHLSHLNPFRVYDRRFFFHEAFKRIEPWQDDYYDLSTSNGLPEPYGYAYKLVVTNYNFRRLFEIYSLKGLADEFDGGEYQVFGAPLDTLEMCDAYFNDVYAAKIHRPISPPRLIINSVISLFLCLWVSAWLFSRARLKVVSKSYFFAADNLGDYRDMILYDQMREGGPVLIVHRTELPEERLNYDEAAFDATTLSRGRVPIKKLWSCLALSIVDAWQIWRKCSHLIPSLYYPLGTMALKRLKYRLFFQTYRPKYFWGRDDYNVEHILRRDELSRIDGVSLGISHAVITNFCALIPMWRYISFDKYYTFGVPLCQPYLDRWPSDMELRSAGMFGISREDMLEDWTSGKGILIASRVAWDEPELKRFVQIVADAFPDTMVSLQFKPGYLTDDQIQEHFEEWRGGRQNVIFRTEPIYDLIRETKYFISDVSTVLGEAMQLGVITFFADVIDMEYSVYREFPGLSIKTAEDMVSNIRSLETGEKIYPHEDYICRMGLDHGKNVYDFVRDDVGLPALGGPKEEILR